MATLPILDFLNKHNIAWLPLNVEIHADITKNKGAPFIPHGFDSKLYYHFGGNPTKDQLTEIQKHLPKCNMIAIDTRKVHQLDIDEVEFDYKDEVENMPYYLSSRKKLPHIFYTSNKKPDGKYNKVAVGDELTGMWAYCSKDAVVYNADCDIQKKEQDEDEDEDEDDERVFENETYNPDVVQQYIRKLVPHHQKTKITKTLANGGFKVNGMFCALEQRAHKSNGQWFFIRGNHLVQKCSDPECDGGETTYQIEIPKCEIVNEEPVVDETELRFIEFEKEHFKLLNPIGYIWSQNEEDVHYTSGGFREYCRDLEKVKVGKKMKPFYDVWVERTNIRKYDKMVLLPPPIPCPPKVYNQWNGWAGSNISKTGGTCEPFLNHLNMLLYNQTNANYLLNWLAFTFQKPALKVKVMVFLVGIEQQTGKTTIWEIIGKIIGSKFFGRTTKPEEDITSKFAPWRAGKLLLCAEDFDPSKVDSNDFLGLITDILTTQEGKGVQRGQVPNYSNYCGASNFIKPVKLSKDDKRYAIFGANPAKCGNQEYFKALYAWADDEANLKALYDYLMNRDISSFDAVRDRPMTEAYKNAKGLSLPSEYSFLQFHIETTKPNCLTGRKLYEEYCEWWKNGGVSNKREPLSEKFFLTNIKVMFLSKPTGITKDVKRDASWYEIDADILKDYLRKSGCDF